MVDLTLERSFSSAPERVFDFVSKTEHLLKWWGPENTFLAEYDMAFDRTGPWVSVMQNPAGQRFKVSGHVTHIDPPHSIGFTWAWHDENDRRGVESHVIIKLVPSQTGGTDFTLTHTGLPDEETAARHTEGWTSSLRKLQALIQTQDT